MQTDTAEFAEIRRSLRDLETRLRALEGWRLLADEDPPETGPYIAWAPRRGPVRTWWCSKSYAHPDKWSVDGEECLPPTHYMPVPSAPVVDVIEGEEAGG